MVNKSIINKALTLNIIMEKLLFGIFVLDKLTSPFFIFGPYAINYSLLF
jgi:hypothetical protein